MIKNMEKVFLNGEMGKNTRENGKMESSMYFIDFIIRVKVLLYYQMVIKEKGYGKTEEGLNGLIKTVSDFYCE